MPIELGAKLDSKKCIITGASGYVGRCISEHLESQGWKITELGRKPSLCPNREFIHWSLNQHIEDSIALSADLLIHCAWDFSVSNQKLAEEVNKQGSIRLFQKAKNNQVKKIIFISTTSAFDDAKTLYGKVKLQVEKEVLILGGIVIRPGLIWGKKIGAMVGALAKVAGSLPIIPLPGNGLQKFYPCSIEDLAVCIDHLANRSDSLKNLGPITAASEKFIYLREILNYYAKKSGKKPLFIPIPCFPIYFVIRLVECLGIKLRFRSDAFLSLMNLNENPDFEVTRRLGLRFRNFGS
jgi:nucleoside-diphosphate-sugar epimerase